MLLLRVFVWRLAIVAQQQTLPLLTDEEREIFARAEDGVAGAGTLLSTCDTVRFLLNNYGRQLLVRVGASDSASARATDFCTKHVRFSAEISSKKQLQQCVSYVVETTLRWRNIVVSGIFIDAPVHTQHCVSMLQSCSP